MCTRRRSPGFIMSVRSFGVNDATFARCGLGGPVGTPLVWMNAKLAGSVQFGLQFPVTGHSRLKVRSAAHQCRLSQLCESIIGAKPGG